MKKVAVINGLAVNGRKSHFSGFIDSIYKHELLYVVHMKVLQIL